MLERISFIGVDERTDLDAILNMKDGVNHWHFPLEFGVLFSKTKQQKGNNRYPSTDAVKSIGKKLHGKVITSLHLCGSSVKEFLNLESEYLELVEHYDRIQLNFRIKDATDQNEMFDMASKIATAAEWCGKPLIIQYNDNKAHLVHFLINDIDLEDIIHVLFDASGGYGVELDKPLPAFDNVLCGYAGGIGPDSVQSILSKIYDANYVDTIFYIDMESKIRTDDWFDVEKCQEVIEKVCAWYCMAHKWNIRPTINE
jgi:hypothetical protein